MAENTNDLQAHQRCLLQLLTEFDRVCKELDIPYMLFAGSMLGAVRHGEIIPWDDDVDVVLLRADYERFLQEAETILDLEVYYLQREFSEHWPMFFSKLRLNGTTCLERYHPKDPEIHQGIYMDIFPCDDAAANGLGRLMQYCAAKVIIAQGLDRRGYDTDNWVKKCWIRLVRNLPSEPFLRMVTGKKAGKRVHTFLAGSSAYGKNLWLRRYFTERVQKRFGQGEYPVSAHSDAMLRQLYGDYWVELPPRKRKEKKHALLVDTRRSYEDYASYRDGMDFLVRTRSRR